MKKALILASFGAMLALSTGCSAQFSSIRKNDDGSYVVTRVKQGFIRMYGTTFLCTPGAGEALTCKEIDSL
jgi:hypothetical protein